MPETPARRPRRYDPDRRQRIVAAALAVVTRDGLDALTHRAVAVEADVQVGSTTYYFATKDQLVFAVLDELVRKGVATFSEQLDKFGAADDLVEALTRLIDDAVANQAEQMLVDYEVFVAVRRRPALRELATRWPGIEQDAIARYTDDDTARMLSEVVEGMLVQFVMYGREFHIDDVRTSFKCAISNT